LNFTHGGDIFKFAKEIGCLTSEVIDLSSNINFLKPNIGLNLESIDILVYPEYESLRDEIAREYGVERENIELFNGATSAIYSLFRFLRGSIEVSTLYAPLYLEYKRASIINSYQIELIDRFSNLKSDIRDSSLVVFVNPSTPDGKFYNLEELIKGWIKKRATIIIDEAFLDFTDYKSAIKFLDYKRLYIIKSLTKFYSCAGVRVGVVISNSKNIKALQSIEPIWKISSFDMEYIRGALRDIEFKKKTREIVAKNRLKLFNILKESSVVDRVYDSSVNFLLFRLESLSAEKFQDALKRFKILVRDCSNFDFLDSSYVRVAIKSDTFIERFKEALWKI